MDPYATVQTIERTTFDLDEDLYVRVVGPYNVATPFSVTVTVTGGTCPSVHNIDGLVPTIDGPTPAAGSLLSLLLTDSGRLSGTDAEVAVALADLQTLAGRGDVNGVVLDLAALNGAGDPLYPRVALANAQADSNPTCPSAKNIVAKEIKQVIDAYRTSNSTGGETTLQYLVLAGGADVIPFFQVLDVSGLANEREYVAPVAPETPSDAGLRSGLVQGQDAYGSQTNLTVAGRTLALAELAVGRLVNDAADISTAIGAYIATNGVVAPDSSLVTGYDFVGDAAAAIASRWKPVPSRPLKPSSSRRAKAPPARTRGQPTNSAPHFSLATMTSWCSPATSAPGTSSPPTTGRICRPARSSSRSRT